MNGASRLMSHLLRLCVYYLLLPFVRFFYRVKGVGIENLPTNGPFLLVSNHVSYIDAMVISVVMDRPVRFLMWRHFYEKTFIGWVCRVFRSIPIEPTGHSGDIRKSLEAVINALKSGDIVCLFPEGR